MSKHTPGPWEQIVECAEDNRIAAIWISGPDKSANVVCDVIPRGAEYTDEDEANARLIAAAPDLLEALRALVDLDDGDKPSLWPISAELERGRAAIAKAEGK